MSLPPKSTMPPFSILTRPSGAAIAYHRIEANGRAAPGDAPGLIFLGGFMSDMTGTKATALEDHARRQGRALLRFDYQGHGASSGRFVEGTIGAWLEDAQDVLDRVTEGPQILIGSSMGGWIALLLARARPGRVHAVVGIAAAPDFTETMWQGLDAAARDELAQNGFYEEPSDYSEEPYLISRALLEDGRDHLLLSGPISIDCPLRLLQGMADEAVPWQTALRISENVTSLDVEVTFIKSGDHRLSSAADLERLFTVIDALPPLPDPQ